MRVTVSRSATAEAQPISNDLSGYNAAQSTAHAGQVGVTRQASGVDFLSPKGMSLTDDSGNQNLFKRAGGEVHCRRLFVNGAEVT